MLALVNDNCAVDDHEFDANGELLGFGAGSGCFDITRVDNRYIGLHPVAEKPPVQNPQTLRGVCSFGFTQDRL